MVTFKLNGHENGKPAYLAQRRAVGTKVTFASIVFDGREWLLKKLPNGRVDRFDTAKDAKEEARKG